MPSAVVFKTHLRHFAPPSADVRLDFGLSPDDPSLQVTENGLSYFDPVNRQTVGLDEKRSVSMLLAASLLPTLPLLSALL